MSIPYIAAETAETKADADWHHPQRRWPRLLHMSAAAAAALILLRLALAWTASEETRVVYLMRHGEKTFNKRNKTAYLYACLSEKGWARAYNLKALFGPQPSPPFRTPSALFAGNYSNPSDCRDEHGWYRTQTTIAPLAAASPGGCMPRSLSLSPLSLSLPPSLPLSLSFFSAPVTPARVNRRPRPRRREWDRLAANSLCCRGARALQAYLGRSRRTSSTLCTSLSLQCRPYLGHTSCKSRPYLGHAPAGRRPSPAARLTTTASAATPRRLGGSRRRPMSPPAPRQHLVGTSRPHLGYTSATRRLRDGTPARVR